MKALHTSIAFAITFLLAGTAYALYALPTIGADVSITADPEQPAPHAQVMLTAESATIDLSNASITWSENGKTLSQGLGKTSVQVTVGDIGSETNVSVHVVGESGSADATIALIPEEVDLIMEANSFVPPFYRGRALPSAGSSIRVQAIPYIVTSAGAVLAPNQLIYTWRENGEVLGAASGLGRSTATIASPALYGASTISVEARSQGGSYSAFATVNVPAVDPSVSLYIDHPLFGVEYWNALGSRASAPDVETAFAAVPYFAPFPSAADPRLSYGWSINGKAVTASSSARNELNISAKGASGAATLSLSLTSTADYSLDANRSWSILFSDIPAAPASPSPGPTDAFHTPSQY